MCYPTPAVAALQQAIPNSCPAKALPPSQRLQIGLQALAGTQTITDLADEFDVSRKFVYRQAATARSALTDAFESPAPDDEVLFHLPVTKAWLRQATLGLTLICLKWTPQTNFNAAVAGVAVAIGCAAHYLGDAITEQGRPMLWPVPIAWRTWYPVAPPKLLRMRTGGKVEMVLVGPVLTLVAVWLSAVVLQRAGLLPFLNGVRLLPPWAAP